MSVFDRQFIIHIAAEVIVISCLGYYFSRRDKITNGKLSKIVEQNTAYEAKIKQLETTVEELKENVARIEAFLFNFTQANMLGRPVQPPVKQHVNKILETVPVVPVHEEEPEPVVERHSPIPVPESVIASQELAEENIDYETLDKELENELAELNK